LEVDVAQKVFVLMPFAPEFDDVYMIIRDACREDALSIDVLCQRADDIQMPGKITDQLIRGIEDADVIIADLTGSNANVMYELGYAHALDKPTILLNQTSESPFDLRIHRQIIYDRTRLVRDCRTRLITALGQVLGHHKPTGVADIPEASPSQNVPVLPTMNVVLHLQALELRMQMARKNGDEQNLVSLAKEAIALTDRITIVDGESRVLETIVNTIGNCAVELEVAGLLQDAENLYKRALSLLPTSVGVNMQYADYLLDRRELAKAREHLSQARQLDPDDRRLVRLELKLAILEGNLDPDVATRVRTNFEENKGDRRALTAYLDYLENINAPMQDYEQACQEWAEASRDPNSNLQSIRILADRVAQLEDYDRAKELYEELLPSLSGEDRHDVLHNVAVACANLGLVDKAKEYWLDSYHLSPQDPAVRAAFSQRLAQWGDLPLAVRVASGEPIDSDSRQTMGSAGSVSGETLATPNKKLPQDQS
jgi:tetratricopeptide (TPR) repeat protein